VSRIAKLISDGVPLLPLASVGTLRRGRRFVKSDIVESGTPCIHYGEIYTGYDISATSTFSYLHPDQASTLRSAHPGDVIIVSAGETIEDIGKAVAWLGDEDVVIHDACYAFHSDLDAKFVVYCLQTKDFRAQVRPYVSTSKISAVSIESLGKVRIPVPPLEVQREIVKVLDAFTALQALLETELEARRVQYAFFVQSLLSSPKGARWMTLGEVGKVSMCKRVFKHETSSKGEIPFYKIGTFGGEPDAFIAHELYESYRARYPFPQRGDVLLSAAGTIGRAIPYDGQPAYFQDSNIVWLANDESIVKNPYLRYWYSVIDWTTDGGTIQRLYNENIRQAKIAVPSIAEQERIVAVLDRFDALVNNRSIGLPAELNARRRQYEYYRDRLLSFPEAA
jgi:type I restriction enzyme S subunit